MLKKYQYGVVFLKKLPCDKQGNFTNDNMQLTWHTTQSPRANGVFSFRCGTQSLMFCAERWGC